MIKIHGERNNETLRYIFKKVPETVVIATTPLGNKTFPAVDTDAASAIKWDISYYFQECSVKTVNQVFENEDIRPTFVGGITTATCCSTSNTEPAANPENGTFVAGLQVKLNIKDQNMLTW